MLGAAVAWSDEKTEKVYPELHALPFVLLSLLALTFMNYREVHTTLNLNIVLTAAAFITIILLLFSTHFYSPTQSLLRLSELSNGLPYGWIGILGAFQFGCWFYLGIEGTVLAAEECRFTGRALPVGSIIGLLTLIIGATITWFGCSGLVNPTILGSSVYPLYDAALATKMPLIIDALFLGTILSCLASANGCIADASRAWYSMSKDTLIPNMFSAVHPKYKTPYRSILFLLPISMAFGYTGLLDQVITFSILSALFVYFSPVT